MARRGLDPPGTTEGEVSRLAMAGVGRGEWTRGPQPRATGAAFHGASFSSQSEEGTPALRGQTAGDQTSASLFLGAQIHLLSTALQHPT